MTKRTALYDKHIAAGGKMVEFAGWSLPIHYGSQMQEHHAVREHAGMFDVSHMAIVDVQGAQAQSYLQYVLANDVAKLTSAGKALYTCMLNHQGGIIDDLIVYHREHDHYRLVVNASTRDKDIAWLSAQTTNFDVSIIPQDSFVMLAIQGPEACERVINVLREHDTDVTTLEGLKRFHGIELNGWFIGRTGYTGEDGFEIMLPANEAQFFWDALLAANVQPCGLGARDTLRLEAGLNLYGSDMDEQVSPLASNVAWTIAWEPESRDFIGRNAISQEKTAGCSEQLVGLVLEGKGVLRAGQKVHTEQGEGVITSGSFSPSLNQAIGLARLPSGALTGCEVEIRQKRHAARVVKPPFYSKK